MLGAVALYQGTSFEEPGMISEEEALFDAAGAAEVVVEDIANDQWKQEGR